MISLSDLRGAAYARLEDAEALEKVGRYDGAVYLCGYAVEIAIKVRICETLGWSDWPDSGGEFDRRGLNSRLMHDLAVLLALSGSEAAIKAAHIQEWSDMLSWKPEMRYRPVGGASATGARKMVRAARTLVNALC